MATPRHQIVCVDATPYYHVVGRCVRRAFLCGSDKSTGRCFEHRRQWLVDRIALLTEVFAIDVLAYTIMSNHYHLVLRIDVTKAEMWPPEEVVDRWETLYGIPSVVREAETGDASPEILKAASEAIETRRDRLRDLSWFMKSVNEFIARKANAEDQCTGAFWEGRFKSQALMDERALLSCMVYVDLNPIRAAMARTPKASNFTSIQQRLIGADGKGIPLMPFRNESSDKPCVPIDRDDYNNLVDWTGRAVVTGKRGAITADTPPILERLRHTHDSWTRSMMLFKNAELKVLGPVETIRSFARQVSRHWFRGMGSCRISLGPG